MKEEKENINGILLINKPKNITSHDVVNIIRKTLNIKKVGHTGTLDPLAEGLLIILLGKCTKLSNFLTFKNKEYIAKIKIGVKTDTLDITGSIIQKNKQTTTKDEVKKTLKTFTKTYLQEVPAYSAVKVKGKKLYNYARENIEVELPKKEVTINSLELLDFTQDSFTIKCNVTKGTYIRSLINDICANLNILGTMESLVRTKQDTYNIENSYTLEEIKKGQYKILTLNELFKDYPIINIENKNLDKIYNGNIIEVKTSSKFYRLINNKKLIAIYMNDKGNAKPIINLINR